MGGRRGRSIRHYDVSNIVLQFMKMHEKILLDELNVQLVHMARGLMVLEACHRKFMDAPLDKLNSVERVWFSQIKEVFYDAENLLDHLDVRAESSEPTINPDGISRLIKQATDPVHKAWDATYLSLLIAHIKHTTARANDMISIRLGARPRVLYKEAKESELVGMDKPRDELIKKLTEGDASMKIVSIVGFAGLGKTTLARAVYHDWAREPQFDCWAFVTVPLEPAGMEGLYTEMLRQLDMENHMNIDQAAKDEGKLISHIREFLQDKRYLVVIDDLRVEEDWHNISRCLPNNVHGSRVLTTTRFDDIANQCCSGCDEAIYEIPCLIYSDSRNLFLKIYFGSEVSCPNAPMDDFYEFLKMCGGTPSAIISIASFLGTGVTAIEPWQEMMNSVHSSWKQTATVHANIPCFEDLTRIVVLLAYLHLPITLKDCLLYLAVHAKNQMIYRTTTVRKWIAEGFIPEYEKFSREEVASQYFDELIERNFIHGNYLEEETYEVNYMVLFVLRMISQEINFATILSDVGISREYGHSVRLFIQCSGSEVTDHTEKMDPLHIRSITVFGPAKFYLTNDLEYLRLLDLDGCKDFDNSDMDYICRMLLLKYLSLKHTLVTEIPPEIGQLRYLETLDIRHTHVSHLPPEIGMLQNLETLDIRQTQVKELSKELFDLPKLAHLYFGQSSSLRGVKLPVGSDQQKSVKVLDTVDSRGWWGSSDDRETTAVRELEVMLHDQPADKDRNDKLLSSIDKYKNLENMIIYGDYNPSDDVILVSPCFPLLERLQVVGRFVKVPRWFAQLSTLKKLDVKVCKLDQDDLKILGGLPVLSTLAVALISILRKKEVAITGRLHSSTCTDLLPLEETCLAGFVNLEVFNFDSHVPWITFEQGAMPLLKKLHVKLYACSAGKFPSGIINLRSLEKIIVRYSSHHASSSGMTNAVAAMREEASSHANPIDIYVNGDHEVFLPITRVDKTVTDTEIEEASNHGNSIEFSVNGDHEVKLSNTRVDETTSVPEIEECF